MLKFADDWPLDHRKLSDSLGQAVAAALTVLEGFEQVIGPLLLAVTDGRQVSIAMTVDPETVQPLSSWVTVTE